MAHHIVLNGSALLERLLAQAPHLLPHARAAHAWGEVLIEGPLYAPSLDAFFTQSATYLAQTYKQPTRHYHTEVVEVAQSLMHLPATDALTLWFERDLFCQANLWFVAHLLAQNPQLPAVHLVLAPLSSPYSFAAMDVPMLEQAAGDALVLNSQCISQLAGLWLPYSLGDARTLQQQAQALPASLSFVQDAVQAFAAAHPTDGSEGRPQALLRQLMAQHTSQAEAPSFGPVFRAFCQQAPEYGYGDLQIKRMYDQLLAGRA